MQKDLQSHSMTEQLQITAWNDISVMIIYYFKELIKFFNHLDDVNKCSLP